MGNEPTRQIDRDRKPKIVAAAIKVITDFGVEGLTHRRVADYAEVPLSATTYYFSSRNDLLIEAFKKAIDANMEKLKQTKSEGVTQQLLLQQLAHMLHDSTTAQTDPESRVITELYGAALRYPELKELVMRWELDWEQTLTPIFSLNQARFLSAAMGGLLQRALIEKHEISVTSALSTLNSFAGQQN